MDKPKTPTVGWLCVSGRRVICDVSMEFTPAMLQSLVGSEMTYKEKGTDDPLQVDIIKQVLVFDYRDVAEDWIKKNIN